MSKVLVVTHGGLGNQLFQIFYGLSLAEKYQAELAIHHVSNYSHSFGLSEYFRALPEAKGVGRLIARLRIPKIVSRLLGSRRSFESYRFGNLVIVDGYFQDLHRYRIFGEEHLTSASAQLIGLIRYTPKKKTEKNIVTHIRVHDLMSQEEAEEFVDTQLDALQSGEYVISNRDDLVRSRIENSVGDVTASHPKHIETAVFTPEQLLELMAGFSEIRGVDSTLSTWASILSDVHLDVSGKSLNELRLFLRKRFQN